LIIGEFVRQHDPDFLDGSSISVFDNNNIAPVGSGASSRIAIKSFVDDSTYTYFKGSDAIPFYSPIMGKHQWLPNGNLLITEGANGRAFEIDPNGNIVWEYVNMVNNKYAGIMEEVLRLPEYFNERFFVEKRKLCSNVPENAFELDN
jgi:hypothetical protein